jgi:hypothetical protein
MIFGLQYWGFDIRNAGSTTVVFQSSLVDSLAEWIAIFVTTNITTKIILLIVNIPIYVVLGRLMFGDWKRFWRVVFWRVVMFSLTPFFVLFRRSIFNSDSWVPPSRAEIGLAILLNLLWLALYFVQYMLIKMIFLN